MRRRSSSASTTATEIIQKYWEMQSFMPARPFVYEALETGLFAASREATEAFNGMLQWLAFHTTKESPSPTVMMTGVVDRMWSLFITSPLKYSEFCNKYAGYIIKRVSMSPGLTPVVRDCGGIQHTVIGLNSAFGLELSSSLRSWEKMRALSGAVKAISFTPTLLASKDSEGQVIFDKLWTEG